MLESRGYVCDTVEVFKDVIYKICISVRRTADEIVGVNIYPDETTPVGEQINKFIECYKNTQIDFDPANLLRWNEVKKKLSCRFIASIIAVLFLLGILQTLRLLQE